MKILVPVDIYDSSYASYEYAVQFAHLIDAEVTLFYVINSVFSNHEMMGYDPYVEMENAVKEKMSIYNARYAEEKGEKLPLPRITSESTFGLPGLAIAEYARSENFDLIIMGIRDKHGILDRILGSVSAETIKEAKCPVMLIHQKTVFQTPEKILFAFDKNTDLDEALDAYKKFNIALKARTYFLHININETEDVSDQKSEIVSELFEKENSQFAFEVKTLRGKNVISGLNDYCYFENIDMISMIHRKEGIFSNLFRTHRSIEVAQQIHIPVIVFQEDKNPKK